MNTLDQRTVGRLTVVAGLVAVLATLALLGFFGGSGLLGSAGDLLDIINSALLIPLFLFLGHITRPLSEAAGRVIQVAGVLGALTRLLGAFLILSRLMIYDDAVLLVNAGMALIGIALVVFLLANRTRPEMGRVYFIFSLVVSLVLVANILGVVLNDQFTPLLRGEVAFAEANPLLVILLVTLAPVLIFGYPILLLWTGRWLLKHEPLAETRLSSA